MSSFSDAHESFNIPIIAANMHRMIPIRQSQIWAVLQPEFSLSLIYYKLSSTFLGRMCLSGDIISLSKLQQNVLTDAITFYKGIVEIINNGESIIEQDCGLSYKNPTGYQIVRRYYQNDLLITIHTFEECSSTLFIDIDSYQIIDTFFHDKINVIVKNNRLKLSNIEAFDGIALKLRRDK